jgi:folate-binding protein YgfZ
MGADAWEIARIVAGRPVVGKELTEDYTPFDAGLYAAVSLNKGCYIGQETLAKVYGRNAQRWELWGLQLSSPVVPGEKVIFHTGDGEASPCGEVTSFADRPVLTSRGPSIEHRALAYLKRRARDGGSVLGARVSVGGVEGIVLNIPFATRELPGGSLPVTEKRSSNEGPQEEKQQSEAERKAAKLAEMQARLSAWKNQNDSTP